MKCPKCKKEGTKYLTRESKQYSSGINERAKRTKRITSDQIAKCSKCSWSGKL